HFDRMAGIMEIDGVNPALEQLFREIDVDGSARRTLEAERQGRLIRLLQKNLIDLKRPHEIQLNAAAVLQHFEADGILTAQGSLLRIYPYVQVVVEQIVVGAIRAIAPAQMIGLGE